MRFVSADGVLRIENFSSTSISWPVSITIRTLYSPGMALEMWNVPSLTITPLNTPSPWNTPSPVMVPEYPSSTTNLPAAVKDAFSYSRINSDWPADTNLPVAFTEPETTISPFSDVQTSRSSGIVSLASQADGTEPSERVPVSIPFPTKVPVPVTDWLFLIVWLRLPVNSSTLAGLDESNWPEPSKIATPWPVK